MIKKLIVMFSEWQGGEKTPSHVDAKRLSIKKLDAEMEKGTMKPVVFRLGQTPLGAVCWAQLVLARPNPPVMRIQLVGAVVLIPAARLKSDLAKLKSQNVIPVMREEIVTRKPPMRLP